MGSSSLIHWVGETRYSSMLKKWTFFRDTRWLLISFARMGY